MFHSEIKLFWRANSSLELSFYLHTESNCLELIMYNVDKEEETSNRLYFDYSKLLVLTAEDASKRLEKRKGELANRVLRRSFTQDTPSDDSLYLDAQIAALVGHVAEKLVLEAADGYSGSDDPRVVVTYDATTLMKENKESPLLDLVPTNLQPVLKIWTKNKKPEDVQEVYDELMACATDIIDVAKAAGHAEKIIQISFMATEYMQKFMQRHQRLRKMGYSKMRLKW